MADLLSCHLLDVACTADDLATVTERAMACARKCEGHDRRRSKAYFVISVANSSSTSSAIFLRVTWLRRLFRLAEISRAAAHDWLLSILLENRL